MATYAQIIIQFAKVPEIDKFFTYEIPEEMDIQVGMRVKVPFGMRNNHQIGYVMAISETPPESKYKMKMIAEFIDEPPILSKEILHLVSYMVKAYGTTYALAIQTVLPPGLTESPITYKRPSEVYYQLAWKRPEVARFCGANCHKKTFEKQKFLLELLLDKGKIEETQLKNCEEFSQSSLQTLIKKGIIQKDIVTIPFKLDDIQDNAFQMLNDEQEVACMHINTCLDDDSSHVILLEGVTGSGKTEVFLHAIRSAIKKKQTAIVLVPEIALTPQTFKRFEERFGNAVALNHSRMNVNERQQLYARVLQGEVSVVIGPRSAVFMPMPNLGLIVIDEEHETTYKSETTPKYHAADLAKERMAFQKGTVLLASATPSIESYYEAEKGNMEKLILTKRATGAMLPNVTIVDMRQELQKGNPNVISEELHEAIETTLKENQQVMLLINRRGHSTFINCRSCGYVVKCKHCDIAMTYHLQDNKVICHHCGSEQAIPEICPECGSKHIRFFGNGTEKVEAYLNTFFHMYGVRRMDFDTTTGKEGHAKILQAFKNREFNVLVGTQMIAKGHDFPNVTLVGVIAADQSLFMQDFRSGERTFQLLTQVLGRAGRGSLAGRVFIQTYNPDNGVLQQVKNFQQKAFYEAELSHREQMGYPPYTHVFQLLITGKNEKEVIQKSHLLAQYYQYYNKKKFFRILGPTVATIGKIADDYRWKIVIIGDERDRIMLYGQYCLEQFQKREKVEQIKISWDIDPFMML
ncbi:MAG: replication restart helicase PriA [Cellulosilyticaceae bacterium]